MTTRTLDALLAPRAVALVGASNEPGSLGNVLARNILSGGFTGPIMPLNPHEHEICGIRSFQKVSQQSSKPDLRRRRNPAARDTAADLRTWTYRLARRGDHHSRIWRRSARGNAGSWPPSSDACHRTELPRLAVSGKRPLAATILDIFQILEGLGRRRTRSDANYGICFRTALIDLRDTATAAGQHVAMLGPSRDRLSEVLRLQKCRTPN